MTNHPDKTILGYTFRDAKLLEVALTHRSVIGHEHNERLEFLGDAVLGEVVAEYLYLEHPDFDEGQLTRARAELVKGSALAQIARANKIGDLLLHAEGTPASERLLASTIEALFGAIALEAGHPKAKEIILGQISAIENFATESEFNAKGALQELLQPTVPTEDICYQCLSEDGPPNNRRYTMGIKIGQIEIPELRETAPTKKQAQNKVAAAALKKLKTDRHLLEKITNSYHRDC